MPARSRWVVLAALAAVALLAYFAGRHVEERALAAKARANTSPSASPSTSSPPASPSYR